ncbi:MAG TPA: tetratricopeptide repeat protein [Candidatus Obscuribacterales bacterium]
MARRIYLDSHEISPDAALVTVATRRAPSCAARPESVAQTRQRVMRAVDMGDFAKAIAMLNRLLTHHPTSAEDYSNRGLIYLWSGHPHKALRDFNHAIALAPELPAAYNNRANCYAAQGQLEAAIADYERTIDLNPFHVRARINYAITLRELDRYDAALEVLDEALLFRQLAGDIYAERGRTYHIRGDWNCAVADYRRALKFFPLPLADAPLSISPRRQQVMGWLTELQPPG